jgi:hypothetical protein
MQWRAMQYIISCVSGHRCNARSEVIYFQKSHCRKETFENGHISQFLGLLGSLSSFLWLSLSRVVSRNLQGFLTSCGESHIQEFKARSVKKSRPPYFDAIFLADDVKYGEITRS